MAMRLVAAIMKERGVKITAKTIMSDPAIRGIASAVGNADAVSTPAGESPVSCGVTIRLQRISAVSTSIGR